MRYKKRYKILCTGNEHGRDAEKKEANRKVNNLSIRATFRNSRFNHY